jgi:hypothetical protein
MRSPFRGIGRFFNNSYLGPAHALVRPFTFSGTLLDNKYYLYISLFEVPHSPEVRSDTLR